MCCNTWIDRFLFNNAILLVAECSSGVITVFTDSEENKQHSVQRTILSRAVRELSGRFPPSLSIVASYRRLLSSSLYFVMSGAVQ